MCVSTAGLGATVVSRGLHAGPNSLAPASAVGTLQPPSQSPPHPKAVFGEATGMPSQSARTHKRFD